MTLIGSAALLWHAAERGLDVPLPENSMDADPVTESDALAWMCYDAIIGSEFEQKHGWHVNLLPSAVLQQLPSDWELRASTHEYGRLTVVGNRSHPESTFCRHFKGSGPCFRMTRVWIVESFSRKMDQTPTREQLPVVVPSPHDLLVPKLKRNEPRDRAHAAWAAEIGLTG